MGRNIEKDNLEKDELKTEELLEEEIRSRKETRNHLVDWNNLKEKE